MPASGRTRLGRALFIPRPVSREKGEPILSLKKTDKDKEKAGAAAPGADPEQEPAKENTQPEEEAPQEDGQEEKTPESSPAEVGEDAPESQPEPEDGAGDGQQVEQDGENPTGGKEPTKEEKPAEETSEPVSDESTRNGGDAADGSDTAQLKADLLDARSKLAAYEAGVSPDMIADAVTLATAEARAAGEVTDEAVSKAMANVLKRHLNGRPPVRTRRRLVVSVWEQTRTAVVAGGPERKPTPAGRSPGTNSTDDRKDK